MDFNPEKALIFGHVSPPTQLLPDLSLLAGPQRRTQQLQGLTGNVTAGGFKHLPDTP